MLLEGGQRWLPPPMTLSAGPSHQTAAQRGGELKVPLQFVSYHTLMLAQCRASCQYVHVEFISVALVVYKRRTNL